MSNYIVYALEEKGDSINKVLVPYRDMDGCFPIFSEELMKQNQSDIQRIENKLTGISEMSHAVELIRMGGHRWKLKAHDSEKAAIFPAEQIIIHEV